MKKILTIFPVLALIVSACANVLEYKSDQEPEVLVMNASMRTDETTHTVFLSISHIGEAVPVKEAELQCFINGEFVAEGTRVSDKNERVAGRYEFDAEIHPGDEVRLEARSGKLEAKATVTAPQAAPLVAVDTVHIERSQYYAFMGYDIPMLGCKLHLQDNPGQADWYRLFVLYEADTPDNAESTVDRRSIGFEFVRDPILCDGNPPVQHVNASVFEIVPVFSEENAFCTFRDLPFADQAADVEIEISYALFSERYDYDPEKDEWGPVRTENKRLRFELMTISREEYEYLNLLGKVSDSAFEGLFLREPVHIPTNVEGGLGFVSVASASTKTVRLHEPEN